MDHDLSDERQLARHAVDIAQAQPVEAAALADRLLAGNGEPPHDLEIAGLARWARGLAHSQLGHTRVAMVDLRAAVGLLERTGPQRDAGRAAVSLAWAETSAGNVDEALETLSWAEARLPVGEAAVAAAQRALILQRGGRVADALEGWNQALRSLRRSGLAVDEAKALHNRAIVHAYRGEYDRAEADLDAAEAIYGSNEERVRLAEVTYNRGFVAARRGNLPRALQLFDEAQQQLHALGVIRPMILIDRVETLLEAGMVREARAWGEAAVAQLAEAGLDIDIAEAALLASRASLEDGDAEAAVSWAARAAELFREQKRPRWLVLAAYSALQAEIAMGGDRSALASRLLRLTDELGQAGWAAAAVDAETSAVTLLLEAGRLDEASRTVVALSRQLRRASVMSRLRIWLATARVREALGDHRGARRALSAALGALEDHRGTLGSSELRAQDASHADAIIALGLALEVDAGQPERAFAWLERVRSTVSAMPQRHTTDPDLAASLELLREVVYRSRHEDLGSRGGARVLRQQRVLEEVIRRRSRHAVGSEPTKNPAPTLESLQAALADRVLIDFAAIGDRVIAAVVDRDSCRMVDVAPVNDVRRAVAALRLILQSEIAADPGDRHADRFVGAATAVEHLVLDPLELDERAARFVIVPSSQLASVPWSALPRLAAIELVVTPSTGCWLASQGLVAATMTRATTTSQPLLVIGPNLRHGDAEIEGIAAVYDTAPIVLKGDDATVASVLDAMSQHLTVHIAAHGVFRSDNPLLSSIELADGPLTGYEVEQLRNLPALIVLSCCDAATSEQEGDATLGVAQLLISAGVMSIIAAAAPVEDEATARLMPRFHEALHTIHSPAAALRSARLAENLVHEPVVAGFLCLGSS